MSIRHLVSTFLVVVIPIFVCSAQGSAQRIQPAPAHKPHAPTPAIAVEVEPMQGLLLTTEPVPEPEAGMIEPPGNQDDPGYAVYKAGYEMVLDEQWDQARKQFSDLITKYPQSEYADDAKYWSAYAMMHIDRKKARNEYEKFIEGNPRSTYCDDAVADLSRLEADVWVVAPEAAKAYIDKGRARGYSYTYSFARNMKQLAQKLRRQTRNLNRLKITGSLLGGPYVPLPDEEELDPETQLKMEALFALGETKEDDKSFQTLKEVALDTKQQRPLREAAMASLANFKKHDVLPVFVEIAKKDTNQDLQSYAVEYISETTKNKNRAVELLVDLFNTIPKERREQTATIFYSIAEIGNDKAVDFLTTVALNHNDYELRREAVYYLGNIGGEKARAALYEILRAK